MLDIFDDSSLSMEEFWEDQIEILSYKTEQRIFKRYMKDWADYVHH